MAGGAGGVEVGRISIRVVPNTDRFRSTLKRKLEEIERTMRAEIPVDADVSRFRRKVEAAVRNLPDATIDVDANTRGVREKIQAQTKGIKAEVDVDVKRGFLDRIAGAMNKIQPPSFGSGINPTGWAVILAGIATAAPLIMGTLGVITTALLSIPGMISAVMVPIGAMALGLEGLGRAAERLKQPFADLKTTMSNAVENQFAPLFDQMLGVFPMLERALPQVTQGLADMAKSALDVVTSDEGMAQIERIIGNIAQALKDAAPGIGDFTEGLMDLVEGFTKRLPDVSDWFNKTGESFKKWAEDFTKEGPDGTSKFDRALDTLGDTLELLGGGLVELGGKALDFLNDPEKVKAFRTEVDGLVNSVLALADALSKISSAMALIPGFSDGKADSPFDFAPFQMQLLKEQLMKVDWSGAFNGLKQAGTTALAGIAMEVGPTVMRIVTTFAGLPGQLAGVFASVVTTAGTVVGQIVAQFSQLPGQVAGAWNGLIGIASGIFSGVVSTAATLIPQIVTTFVTVGGQVIAEVSSWPGRIIGALGDLAGQLREAGARAGQALVQGLAGAIAGGVSAVAGAVGQLMAAARNLIPNSPAKEGPFSGSGWQAVTGFGKTLADGLTSGMPAAQDQVVSQIREIMQAIKDVFGELKGLTINFNLGGAMTGLQTTMADTATAAQDFRQNITGSVNPARKLDAETRRQLDELQIQKDQLELQRQQLQAQRNATTDKGQRAALQQQMDQLSLQKQQLQLQAQQLEYQGKYTDSVAATNDEFNSMLNNALKIPWDFAKATGEQFLSDFGVGGGALTAALEQGIQFGEQFIFNVGSMDEALQGQQNIVNKKALQFNQR